MKNDLKERNNQLTTNKEELSDSKTTQLGLLKHTKHLDRKIDLSDERIKELMNIIEMLEAD